MEHRSEYRWNVIHTMGTPMEREAQNSSDERKKREERPHEKFNYLLIFIIFLDLSKSYV